MQKSTRDVIERLKPMLGFGVRVTERGGTNLGFIISNKNLWSGQPCGRGQRRPCAQEGDRKEADRDGQGEKRDVASLYVGELARSLNESAGEIGETQGPTKKRAS